MNNSRLFTTRRADAEGLVDLRRVRRWYDQQGTPATAPADGQTTGTATTPTPTPQTAGETPAAPATWEEWIGSLAEDQRTQVTTLFNAHTSGLQNALREEREGRKKMEGDLRAAHSKAEDGSAIKQQLEAAVAQLEAANRRADFMAAAIAPEIGVADLAAAWVIVNASPDTYLKKAGGFDFAALKAAHPVLFKAPPPPKAAAGAGTQADPEPATNMNVLIRRAAGRQ